MSSKPSWGPHSPTRHHAGQLPSADVPLWRLLRKLVAVRTTATVRLLRRSRKARSRAAVGLAAVLLAAGTVYVCVRLPSASAARILTTRASPPEGQRRAGGGDARPQDLDSVLRLGGRSRSRFAGASEPVGGADAVSGPGSASAGDAAGLGTPRGRATAEADGGAAGIVDGIVDELRSRGEGEAGYAEQLRRRAAELSVEISRFKGRAAPQSKQERLQMAARVLSTQLTALKQRAGALTLGVGGSALGVGGSGFDQAMASGRAVGGGAVGGGGKRAGAAGGGSAGGAARSMAAGSAAGGGAHSALGDGATGGLTGNGAVGTAAGSAAGGLAGGAAEAASDGVADTGGWGWRDLPSQEPTGRASTADAPLSHESTGRASTDDALCGGVRHPDFRIAMIIPWLDGGVGEAAHPPAWFPHLAATAAHSALLVDWIILHEGSLSLPPATRPPNVRLFDLHPDGIARLFSSRLSGTLSLAREEARAVEQRMMLMFGKWPRLVAEYKPAYGEIFSQWLGNYTHWGYTDFDTIVGQLPRFIERSELTEHHIVTYSFGDTDAVYLRGQWTVHRNSAGVNRLWRQCAHLSDGLLHELSLKVAHLHKMEAAGKASYHKRFLSAEGCYSFKAAHTKGVRIKVATKQFVGMGKQAAHVYALGGAIWRCDRELAAPEINELLAATKPACGHALRGVQSPVGQPQRQPISGSGCGGWMPPEFRMCAPQLRDAGPHSLLLHDGEVFSQRVESDPVVTALRGACHEGAFFHMQEWKKKWAREGAANVDPEARVNAFRISESGIHAIPGMLRGV